MSEEVEELKRRLEQLEIERQREVLQVTSELEAVRKEATATLQKMMDAEVGYAAERANQDILHQTTVNATESMYRSCIDELTSEVEKLKMENFNLKEALKASQND